MTIMSHAAMLPEESVENVEVPVRIIEMAQCVRLVRTGELARALPFSSKLSRLPGKGSSNHMVKDKGLELLSGDSDAV
jgi:hypothetical protein